MSKRNDKLLLEDILDSIEKIFRYTHGFDLDRFVQNDLVVDAVTRNFEIIGEASNRLSNDLRDKYPHIKWRQIIGFRNRIVHEYFGVDYNIMWHIIKDFLGDLKIQITKLLSQERNFYT